MKSANHDTMVKAYYIHDLLRLDEATHHRLPANQQIIWREHSLLLKQQRCMMRQRWIVCNPKG